MTDMQIKYWDLESQKALREAQSQKAIAEAARAKEESVRTAQLTPLEVQEYGRKITNMEAELLRILAQTDLSAAQKEKALTEIKLAKGDAIYRYINNLRNLIPYTSQDPSKQLGEIVKLFTGGGKITPYDFM